MATTISRYSFTDDTGDGESGDVLNAALIGASIYDKIDALIAANITFGGRIAAQGFGDHDFSAGGTGANSLRVRNTTAGTANKARIALLNDVGTPIDIAAFSTTFTTSGAEVTDGGLIEFARAGGGSIQASHASGEIRFYSGGSTLRGGFAAGGGFYVQDGITAPTADTGRAFIYVDSGDGDLKVKFGDGITKTLATDT